MKRLVAWVARKLFRMRVEETAPGEHHVTFGWWPFQGDNEVVVVHTTEEEEA